ncbi:PREDICTED: uncharacterized protein LOC108768265 [Trachymyrmex cornetzi]|uniref:THAP-type domain-containing protein n=1 Tax=Trachymyrmex cornetzi TaxID=471704 RepID=A0A195EKF6_9HYME|nr:PREDICTED: uncharacterized protein LOC108768265 [Trachymyrmex cornetzi]KYN28723.1 hypothetical protein ALC57_01685 [Trachymyrmex cornetzi]
MVRACCVPECSSGKNIPSHMFPKDAQRHKKWFEKLNMKPIENENEIKKLRICYKHFSDEDYSGSSSRRVLLHAAIPSLNIPHIVYMNVKHSEQHTNDEQQTLHNCIMQQESNRKVLAQHSMQLQKQEEILMEQQETIMRQQNDIENIKNTLAMSNPRHILGRITRKNLLSPTVKRLYSNIVEMKRDKRQLMKLVDKATVKSTTRKRNANSIDKAKFY